MTSLSKPNYPVEIGHSPEEEGAFDEEKINFSPSSLRQLQDDSICFSSSKSVEDKEDETAGDEEGDDNAENNKKKKTGTGKLACTILAGISALTTAVVVGVSVNSNRRAQSQISTSLLAGGQSKSAKAAPYCDRLTCGQTFTGGKVTLTEDLFCDDSWTDATQKKQRNCAITLEDYAELDCNGFTVSQIFSDTSKNIEDLLNCADGGGSASDATAGEKNKAEKENCGEMNYYRGICLRGNAKAKNCHVERFLQGFHVLNSGEIKESLASQNRVGIFVEDGPGDTTKISNTIVRGNAQGVDVQKSSTGNTISIDQVRSNNNVGSTSVAKYGDGLHLDGEKITVKNSEASYNGRNGLVIDGGGTTEVDLEGTNFFRYNNGNGIVTDKIKNGALSGTLTVDGKVNTYGNKVDGFRLNDDSEFDVEVKNGGSLLSCENKRDDIRNNNNGGTSSFGGNGYTCDSTKGGPVPVCDPCPSCPP